MKNFNVNLTFTANTAQAKAQMKDLQTTLEQLGKSSKLGDSMEKELTGVKSTIEQVRIAFQQATDPSTGQVNINTLRTSLKTFGLEATDIKAKLGLMGVEGQLAFMKIAGAVQNAQMPLKRTDTILTKMWGTLANTARWQMSSAALMAVTSTFSSAMQYAQDLNKSLNNIRIVTGYNTTEMERFAKQANKAAKALSVSTTEYTDAALIYYQQGLSNEEVLERAEVTVKLANAVGESAQTVSEWMTAVWNNFDNGSKSLEYYADVMAALGAATASSADEIAQGLEKFAAIADTVGLSYEYATAALTTVTAQTRQSADVVGTAFKTMFARIQDLELGKTLEDGTSLGEYSETLHKVGVEVLALDGQMREMDTILNDLGTRWDKLSKAEQVAVAQGVAGIRQYSQMIALMDNWEEFQNNLNIAQMAEGALDVQADTYAESWEAASARVKASAEGIYDSILNDKVFIKFNNQIADVLGVVEHLVDAMGGLPGILALVTVGITKAFGPSILGGLTSFKGLIADLSGQTAALNTSFKAGFSKAQYDWNDTNSEIMKTSTGKAAKSIMDQRGDIDSAIGDLGAKLSPEAAESVRALRVEIERLEEAYLEAAQAEDQIRGLDQAVISAQDEVNAAENQLKTNKEALADAEANKNIAREALEAEGGSYQAAIAHHKKGQTLTPAEEAYIQASEKVVEVRNQVANSEKAVQQSREHLEKTTQEAENAEENLSMAEGKTTEAAQELELATGKLKTRLEDQNAVINAGQSWMNFASALSMCAMSLSSFQSLISTWNNDDLSVGEKLMNTFTSIAMLAPMAVMGVKSFMDLDYSAMGKSIGNLVTKIGEWNIAQKEEITTARLNKKEKKAQAAAERNLEKQKRKTTQASKDLTAAQGTETSAGGTDTTVTATQAGSEILLSEAKEEVTEDTVNNTVAQGAETGSQIVDIGVNEAQGVSEEKLALKKGGGNISNGGKSLGGKGSSAAMKAGLKYLGGIALIAAGVAVAYTGIKLLVNYYNKAEKAAQKAAKHAKVMQETYAQTVEETKKMQEAFSAYDEAIDKTRQLAKGTLEYKQALMEANEKAWELINTYGLTQKDYKIVNGEVIISDDAKNRVLKEQLNQQRRDQVAMAQAQTNANSARIKANQVSAAREVHINDWAEEAGYTGAGLATGAGSGALIGAGIGSLVPVIGIGIGAAILGGLIGAISGAVAANGASEAEIKLVDTLTERVLKNEDMSTEALKVSIDGLKDATDSEIEALIRTAESNAKLVQANEAVYDQIGLQIAEMRGIEEEQSGVVGNWARESDKKMDPLYKHFEKQLNDNDKQMQQLWKIYNKGSLSDMWGNNISIVAEDGTKTSAEQADVAARLVDQLRADLEANFEDYKEGGAKYNELKSLVTESGNGGFMTMLAPILEEYNLLNEELKEKIKSSQEKAQQLKQLSLYDDDTALTSVLEQFDDLQSGTGNIDQINLAKAGMSWQDIEELQKELYNNWDSFDTKVALLLEEGIHNYATDIQTTIKEANDQFDIETILADQASKAQALAGIDAQVYATYIDSLENATGATTEFATALANTNLIIEQSAKNLFDSYNKYSKVFAKGDKTSLEWSQAIGAIKTDLSQMFAGYNPTTEFVEALVTSGNLAALLDNENIQADFIALLEQITDDMAYSIGAPKWLREEISKEFAKIDISNLTLGDSLVNTGLKFDYLKTQATEGNMSLKDFVNLLGAQGFKFTGDTELLENGNLDYASLEATDFSYVGLGTVDLQAIAEEYAQQIKDWLKDLEAAKERYHEINELLNDNKSLQDAISKSKDRAYGKTKLGYIESEIKLQEKQIQLQQQYADEIDAYLNKDRQKILDLGITLDEEGRINNYDEAYSKMLQQAEALYGTDKEAAQKFVDNWKEAISQYEETLNKKEAVYLEHLELVAQKHSRQLEKITTQVESNLELADKGLEVIKWQLDNIEDDAFAAAEAIGLINQQAENSLAQYEEYKRGIAAIGALGVENFTEEDIKKLYEYRKGLMDISTEMHELEKTIQEKVVSALEEFNKEFEKNIKKVEHNSALLENYRNIIDLVGKEKLGIDNKLEASLSAAAVNAAQTNIKVAKAQLDFNKSALEDAKKALTDGTITQETYDTIEQSFKDSEIQLLESLTAATEVAAQEFELAVSRIMEDYSKAMGGIAGSIEDLTKQFEQTLEVSEFYFQDYRKIYETNKLNRSILEAIDKTDSAKAQKELAEIAKEVMSYQKQGAQMTEWDLNLLEKKFALKQAEIALEEAQNAKREVRLTRDSQGNYGYVYTANEEEVNKARQNMEDALFDLQDYLYEMDKELTNRFLSLNESFMEEMAALDKNADDYEERAAEIVTKYGIQFTQLEGEMQGMVDFGKKLNSEYGTSVADTFHATMIGSLYQDTNNFKELTDKTLEGLKGTLDAVGGAHTTFADNVSGAFEAAGTGIGEFSGEVDKKVNGEGGINDDLTSIGDTVDTLPDKFDTAFEGVLDEVQEFQTKFGSKVDEINGITEALITKIQTLLSLYEKASETSLVEDIGYYDLGTKDDKGLSQFGTVYKVNDKWYTEEELKNHNSTDAVKVGGAVRTAGAAEYSGSAKVINSNDRQAIWNSQTAPSEPPENTTVNPNITPTVTENKVTRRGVRKDKDGTIHRVVQINNGRWYDQKDVTDKDIVQVGDTVNANIDIKDAISTKEVNHGQSSFTDLTEGDYEATKNELKVIDVDDSGTITLYQLSNQKWYTKDELIGGRFYNGDSLMQGPGVLGAINEGDYVIPRTLSPRYKNPDQFDIITLKPYSGENLWDLTDTTIYDAEGNKVKKGNYMIGDYDQPISFDGYRYNNSTDTGLYHAKDKVIYDQDFWTGKKKYTYWFNRTDAYQMLPEAEDEDPILHQKTWYDDFRLEKLDTGGYTGSWGPEGRLAMLHQKEIVLNAHDTENLLTTVQIVRSMADKLELSARLAQQGLGAVASVSKIPGGNGTLDQNVTIHAEFPNATNHLEIEEAFRNLTNMAAQYASRR